MYENLARQAREYKRKCNQHSFKTRERYFNATLPFCRFLAENYGLQKLANVGAKHFYAYTEHMKEYKAAATIQSELSGIRAVLHFLGDKNPLPENSKLDLPKRKVGVLDKSWTQEEYDGMLDLVTSMGRADIHYGSRLMWTFGLRIKEAASLRVWQVRNAIQYDGLNIIKGKGGKDRMVPVFNDEQRKLLADLKEYYEQKGLRTGDFIISDKCLGGVTATIKRMENWLYNHKKKFILPDRADATEDGKKTREDTITWHGLRHEFAQRYYAELRKRGYSKHQAKQMVSLALGHERWAITMIYLDDLPAGKRKG